MCCKSSAVSPFGDGRVGQWSQQRTTQDTPGGSMQHACVAFAVAGWDGLRLRCRIEVEMGDSPVRLVAVAVGSTVVLQV